MKFRRIAAVVVALVLLLGLLPVEALAATATDSYCPSGRSGSNTHSWGDWTVTKAATCTSAGQRVRACRYCGYEQSQAIAKTGHSYGSWKTTKKATCTQNGEQVRTCKVCGHKDTRKTDKTPHQYGEWTILQAPTCTEKGKGTHTCTVCGHEATGSIPKLDHDFGEWTITTPTTDFSAGVRTRSCSMCGLQETEDFDPEGTLRRGDRGEAVTALQEGLNDAGYDVGRADGIFGGRTERGVRGFESANSLEADGVAWPGVQAMLGLRSGIPAGNPGDEAASGGLALTVTPDIESTDVTEGDQVRFVILMKNDTNEVVSQPRMLAYDGFGSLLHTYGRETGGISSTLQANQTYTFTAEDAEAGEVTLRWTGSAEVSTGSVEAEPVEITYRVSRKGDALPAAGNYDWNPPVFLTESKVSVTVGVISEPANGESYVLGERVYYAVVVKKSSSDPLKDIEFYDTLHGSGAENRLMVISSYESSKSALCPKFEYYITQADVDRGYIALGAYIVFKGPSGNPFYATTAKDTILPTGKGEAPAPSMTVTVADMGDKTAVLGSTFEVPIVVHNAGKVSLKNLSLASTACGGTESFPETTDNWFIGYGVKNSFHPGEDYTMTYTLTVTEKDVDYNGLTVDRKLVFTANSAADGQEVTDEATITLRLASIEAPDEPDEPEEPGAPDEPDDEPNEPGAPDEPDDEPNEPGDEPNEPGAPDEPGDEPNPPTDDISVEKFIYSGPANGSHYVEGEAIQYIVRVTNNSDHTINEIEVYDPMMGSNEDMMVDFIPVLDPSDPPYETPPLSYVVQASDVGSMIFNIAFAVWNDPLTGEERKTWSNRVPAPTGREDDGIVVVKSIENLPERGFFIEGEVIDFAIHVENHSDRAIYDMEIYDPLGDNPIIDKFPVLPPVIGGGTVHLYYTVTAMDAANLSVHNMAFARFFLDGAFTVVSSNEVEAPTGAIGDPFGVITGAEVEKVETSAPANGKYYQKGETITYLITVHNCGETTLYDVLVHDTLAGGSQEFAAIEMLHPNEWRVYPFSYTVGKSDVKAGKVVNYAWLGWEIEGYPYEAWSEPVISPTGEEKAPATPDSETESEPEPDCCVRVLTGWGEGASEYRIDHCAAHAAVSEKAGALIAQATTDDEQLAAWRQAVSLWTAALNAEYDAVLSAVPEDARPIVANERALFYLQLACAQDAAERGSDDPLLAAMRTVDQLANRVADMCYERSLAPADRRDSLVTGAYDALENGADADDCARTVTVDGPHRVTAVIGCADHSAIDAAVDAMIAGDAGNPALTMRSAKQLWLVALDAVANRLYTGAEDDLKPLIAAERVSYGNWLKSREAYLELMYPGRPEIVEETLMHAVRDRAAALCAEGANP